MKVSEIFNKEIVYYGGITNPNFGVSYGRSNTNLDTLPDVEFGRTYFIRANKNGLWSLYGVKFYGIVNSYCGDYGRDSQKMMLIGSLSTGETVYFSNYKQIYFDIHGRQHNNILSKRLFASVNDFNDDAEVVSITINYAKIRLINYLYPDKFKFYKGADETLYMFRFIWNGEKVLCDNKISLNEYFMIFFTKPLFNVWFADSEYVYYHYNKESIKLGVLLMNKNNGILNDELNEKINNFINNTYGTLEECRSKNEMKVYRFEGEEDEEEENEDELIYIEFVGLVTREKAKRIFAELCDKNIEK